MDEITAVVNGECERFGDVRTALIIGHISEEMLGGLAGEVRMLSGDGDVLGAILEADPADLVVYVVSLENVRPASRSLGRALEAIVERGLILISETGKDVPIPLIELRRGLIHGMPELSYRTYGRQ